QVAIASIAAQTIAGRKGLRIQKLPAMSAAMNSTASIVRVRSWRTSVIGIAPLAIVSSFLAQLPRRRQEPLAPSVLRPRLGTLEQTPCADDDGQVDHAAFEGDGALALRGRRVERRDQTACPIQLTGRSAVLLVDDRHVRGMDAGCGGETERPPA